jgi:colanic acid biosynthesis glycosyl transferase WcaI
MKSIIFIVHYFHPDYASTGQLMTELCRELQNNFNISVICVVPGYSSETTEKTFKYKRINHEKFENINIIRVSASKLNKKNKFSRILHIFTYFINAITAICMTKKHDYVFSISQPPVLGGLLGAITKLIKGSKLIYNIQDFNPEQIEAIGYSKNKFLIKLAKIYDNISCNFADRIVIVGRDMLDTLKKRKIKRLDKNIVIINNWINEEEIYPLQKSHPKVKSFLQNNGLDDKIVIMYSGNIGLYYDLGNLIKSIGKFRNCENVIFVFVGEGVLKDKLIKYCNDNSITNVKFLPYQKKEDLLYSLNAADIHLVSNHKGIKGVSVPSKIYGVMAAGKSVLGVLEEGSEAEIIISESSCGICSESGDCISFEKNIEFFINANNCDQIEVMSKNARTFLEKNFGMRKSIVDYITMFESL